MADFTTAHDDLVREYFLQVVSALVPSESLETTLLQTVRPFMDYAAYHGWPVTYATYSAPYRSRSRGTPGLVSR